MTRDSRVYTSAATYGILSDGSDERIRNNLVYTPAARTVVGIALSGARSSVVGNTVVAMEPMNNGYGSLFRAVGIGMGNTSAYTRARGNLTSGFDVGIGSSHAYQARPYYLENHESIGDVLAVDTFGLIPE